MPARSVSPSKLRPGDHVRVIAPSRSCALVLEHDHSALIGDRFAETALSLSFGEHVDERDAFDSAAMQGTAYWPNVDGAILGVEDDEMSDPADFAGDLTSLLQQPDAAGIRGLVIDRFQRASEVTRANPLATLPLDGRVEVIASDQPRLRILDH
jgi:muramoyltetrapeptide carboxypeptidase LdcA involved in peptidoglycan recycling